MRLAATDVADLQGFLLDAAKRYVAPRDGGLARASDLLSSAAALDYVLAMSSFTSDDPSAYAPATVTGLRETLGRAFAAAFDFSETMLREDGETFSDFSRRHLLGERGLFAVYASLKASEAIACTELDFRAVTLRNDLLERGARP